MEVTSSQPLDGVSIEMLDLLRKIKAPFNANYPFLESVPLEEMPEKCDPENSVHIYKEGFQLETNYLGLTVFDLVKRDTFTKFVPKRIEIRLRASGKPLEMVRLVPTLIHELAHVYHEHGRKQATVIRKRKLKRLNDDAHTHDDEFYRCFTELLVAAKAFGIYLLPRQFSQMTPRHIRKFDQQDLIQCPLALCGTSSLLDSLLQAVLDSKKLTETQLSISPPTFSSSTIDIPISIIVYDATGKKKPLTLQKRQIAVLLRESRLKLNLRKRAGRALLANGTELTNDSLQSLEDQTEILILPAK